jgi:hypothetical protein
MEASEIAQLAPDLSRLRRRSARLKLKIRSSPAAWQTWSSTVDEIAGIIETMVAAPAHDVADLALQFRAVLGQIETNDSLMDQGDARRLRRFRRNLKRLAEV